MFLLITTGIVGGVSLWLIQRLGENLPIIFFGTTIFPNNQVITSGSPLSPPPSLTDSGTFFFPTKVTPGTIIKVSNSTSMALFNRALKNGFEQQFPETKVIVNTQKSNKSIQSLLMGSADVAVISRDITSNEKILGLTSVLIAKDEVAIIISPQNSFRHGLTQAQVIDIFQGKITDWSALGRSSGAIRVINHPFASSTRQIFEELILKREDNKNTPDIAITTQDTDTSILRNLGTNDISYMIYSQITNEKTVRIIPIDDHTLEVPKYPYRRSLYYVYKKPPSETVDLFLGYATSPMGQQIVTDTLMK
ncbi:substrate-binding domain-containing protein [Cyanobacterium sp. uoEpiScrs1]|uniref:substrate-binding domain-containing protein n=1 Tax=Cyanobacterium sp. uoEpiScrs1 TaxID=2976343 RepID=UPI00226A6FAF|nr:substrate-binding domain-containing protein [Cyanobacterium sp. uoEpiScrs1]